MAWIWLLAFSVLVVRGEHPGAGFVGVGYNLLTGNPDGGDSSRGDVDPGLLYTRKIFEIGPGDNPRQVVFENRHSCVEVQTTHVFYGAKSYQDKLSLGVKSSGNVNAGLAGFAFSLSGRYAKTRNETNQQRQVFQDNQHVCNLGRARFAEELSQAEGFSVSPNFAAAVCRLPVQYQKNQYMQFLDDWGTHVTMEVELGSKQIKRYSSTLTQFVEHVRKVGSAGVSLGGSYMGYGASLAVNFEKFKATDSYNVNFGTYQYTLQAGSETLPEPIGITVMTLDTVLQPKYWQNMTDFIRRGFCAAGAGASITAWKANIVTALGEYAAYKLAPVSTDPLLKIPLTWPRGTFGLLKPRSGCPGGRFRWYEGWRYEDLEDFMNRNDWTKNNHFAGIFDSNVRRDYCIKGTNKVSDYDMAWPPGDFCVLKYGSCPQGFSEGYVLWNDQDRSNNNAAGGTLPDGVYNQNTKVFYCCRNDGLPTTEIALPNDRPFYLLRHTRGCQRVAGMVMRVEWLYLDTEDFAWSSAKTGGSHPYDDGGRSGHRLHYCYYFPGVSQSLVG